MVFAVCFSKLILPATCLCAGVLQRSGKEGERLKKRLENRLEKRDLCAGHFCLVPLFAFHVATVSQAQSSIVHLVLVFFLVFCKDHSTPSVSRCFALPLRIDTTDRTSH